MSKSSSLHLVKGYVHIGKDDLIFGTTLLAADDPPNAACKHVSCVQGYIQNAIAAVQQDGVNVQGYFAWSLLDNFEWADGFEYRFGIVHVDYSTLLRYVKESGKFLAAWFSASTTAVSNPQATAG